MSMNNKSYIPFKRENYIKINDTYEKWWSNQLERTIVPIYFYDAESEREPSSYPGINFMTAWDFNITPEQFVDAYDWQFSKTRYYGEAFPRMHMTGFGPGAAATFMGCTPQPKPETVWFLPEKNVPIKDLHFEYDPNNKYLRRVLDIYEAAMDKWHGEVLVEMADLGGNLDILASFRDAENLLVDLYDSPDEVLRCVWEIQALWVKYFDMISDIMKSEACGYTYWYGLYNPKPSYILQSDFCYMIGPDMFDTFVAPELKATSEHMHNATYHLDGVGELPHLGSIMKIDSIKGIQWVHGDGEAAYKDWTHVIKQIVDGGKKALSWTENQDGTIRDFIKKPCMAYTGGRYFHYDKDGIEQAKKYAYKLGYELEI